MMKILYILPVLAVLGMISGADATADQERIDELEAKIDRLETKIDRLEDRIDGLDPATDQKRIDKIEAKIDKFEARIDKFEAQIDRLEARDNDADTTKDTGDATQTQQERYSRDAANTATFYPADTPVSAQANHDTDKPTFVSATYNSESTPLTLTITFNEAIDVSQVSLDDMTVFDVTDRYQVYWSLSGANVASSSNSEVLELTLPEPYRNAIGELDTPKLGFEAGAVRDVAGNAIDAATDLKIAIFPEPPPTVIPDPRVTIESTPAGDRFVANVDMIALAPSEGTFTVEFVNSGSASHEVLIDLLFGSSPNHSRDVTIAPGNTTPLIFNVPDSMESGDTAYLLFGVWGDRVKGDHFIKVSIQ